MMATPTLEFHADQPYVGIRRQVTIAEIDTLLAPLYPEVSTWLEGQGVLAGGAPFFRYYSMEMDAKIEMEVGIPVHSIPPLTGEIQAGVLPAGQYATLKHIGDYDGLYDLTTYLLAWIEEQGMTLAISTTEQGEVWKSRLEWYLNVEEPVIEKRESILAFLVVAKE
jgi:effector-binding domain-containing protein